MSRKLGNILAFAFVGSLSLGGCLSAAPTADPMNPTPVDPAGSTSNSDPNGLGLGPGSASGAPDNTFDHPDNQVDPFEVLQRIQEQGPPEVSSRLHSCQKMRYRTLGTVLTQLGVDLNKTGTAPQLTAGQLYKGGTGALGVANYGARIAESIELTTSGATKLFDIFTQAAPEIIAAMPNAATCKVGGQATQMFDGAGKCTLAGITCLQGAPATQAQVDLCNQVIGEASAQNIGQTLAVATILSAQHSCE
jgi:hypothetical protein